MTALEKLKKERPEDLDKDGFPYHCPITYGYLGDPDYCDDPDYGSCKLRCSDCWSREIPETNLVIGDSKIEHPDTDIPAKKIICAHIGHPDPVGEPGEPGVPVILDSGNRRQFESGAVRDIQEGKGRCDLLPLDVVAAIYTAFFPEDPDLGDVMTHISAFMATGEVTHLYQALDDFVHKQFKQTWSEMFLQVAIHFEEGAKKYGENNWQKGIPVHCYIDSAVRHYLKFLRGDKDEPHDRAFCWNIMCAIWTCKHKPELNEYDQRGEFLRKDLNVPKDVALSIDKGEE